MINDRIDSFRGDLLARVALMPGLAAATSFGRRLGLGPGGVWRVGRRRDRGVPGMIAEALLELGDGGLEQGHPLPEPIAFGATR